LAALSFLAVCLTVLCLATVLGAAVLLAVVAAGAAAGAPVWANTGSASADNRAATMMADDFMMVSFLGQAIEVCGAVAVCANELTWRPQVR